jgi:hypothetical protein
MGPLMSMRNPKTLEEKVSLAIIFLLEHGGVARLKRDWRGKSVPINSMRLVAVGSSARQVKGCAQCSVCECDRLSARGVVKGPSGSQARPLRAHRQSEPRRPVWAGTGEGSEARGTLGSSRDRQLGLAPVGSIGLRPRVRPRVAVWPSAPSVARSPRP